MIRGAILALFLFVLGPAVALAQDPAEGEPEKVSNDQPSRPMQMPAASSEVKEAFDDFARFIRRGAWERAAKALYAIPEAQAARFVDGPDGFIIPVARKRRSLLAGLSPEGMAAYRLFYDAEAKKLLDGAEGPTEQATLEKLFSAYFFTSVGDNAADRLGDLYFEQARFDNAADCWQAILRERADSEIPSALLSVKAALALARAGRRAEAEAIRAELAERSADEVVTVAGRKAKVADHLQKALGPLRPPEISAATPTTPAARPVADAPLALVDTVGAAWQVRFGASVTAGMTPLEASQWDNNPLSAAVPAVAIEGSTLFVNYVGYIFALDLASGKMLWRSSSFHNLEVTAMQGQAQSLDTKRYAILAAPGLVWTLGRDLKNMNMQGTAALVCRRAETGEVVWQSSDLADYAGMNLAGLPVMANGTIYLAGKSSNSGNGNGMMMMGMGMGGGMFGNDGMPRQYVLAIQPHDGKILWKTEVGMFREAQQYFYYGMGDTTPQPRLTYRAGSIFLDTHLGVLARLDAESGRLDWGYAYPTDPVQSQSRFFFFGMNQNQAPTPLGAPPMPAGDVLLIKGAKADRICAIDPDRMKLVWDRPIAKTARLLGVDDQTVYLGGPELGALDRKTRTLRWSTPMPGGSEDGNVLVRPDGLWQLTTRGIFEVDLKSGQVRRIFRGEDTGAMGGDLVLTDRWLLAISNRTISAYPRGAARAERAAAPEGAATPSQTRGSDE